MSEHEHDDDVELAMTESEWEAWQREQPPERDDPDDEPNEPWARDESLVGKLGEWLGWRR